MRARFITTDEIGNLYVVKSDNNLVRYGPAGDSNAFFRSITNGDIGAVDATNPLSILVYYPRQSRITVLDRMLAPKSEIDLRALGIVAQTAVASSADGGIWVYDPFNARLKKFSENGKQILESNDLRLELANVPHAHALMERDRRVYLTDTARGVYIFDRFASPLLAEAFPAAGEGELYVAGKTTFLYRRADTIFAQDLNTRVSIVAPIPPSVQDASRVRSMATTNGVFYILREQSLTRYTQQR